jgi:hypothetical protein
MKTSHFVHRKIIRLVIMVEKEPVDLHAFRETIPPPVYRIIFKISKVFEGFAVKTITAAMEARLHHDDETQLRKDLLASKHLESITLSTDEDLFDKCCEPIVSELVDPHGVKEWLFKDMDITEFFESTKLLNDKPIRIAAPDTGNL